MFASDMDVKEGEALLVGTVPSSEETNVKEGGGSGGSGLQSCSGGSGFRCTGLPGLRVGISDNVFIPGGIVPGCVHKRARGFFLPF